MEKKNLKESYGISATDYSFVDGSGGGDSVATTAVVTQFLTQMHKRGDFAQYRASFPVLGVDGSLATVTGFESDATLARAKGQVYAKTGTYVGEARGGLELKGQAFGGYITTRGGRKVAYQLVVNGVPITGILDILKAFQDEGTISAILWRDF